MQQPYKWIDITPLINTTAGILGGFNSITIYGDNGSAETFLVKRRDYARGKVWGVQINA